MTSLIIDTSTERGIVACLRDQSPLFCCELPFGLLSSQFLLPELHRELKLHDIDVSSLSKIIVGIGPGSYTGIRVGVIVGKTLSFALKLPLIGIPSLDGFVPNQDGPFATVIDAKIGGVYLQKGVLNRGLIKVTLPRQVLPLADAARLLIDTPLLVTSNANTLQSKFAALAPEKSWQWQESYPSPLRLASLGNAAFLEGNYTLDGDLELLYMRKTQAELEKENFST